MYAPDRQAAGAKAAGMDAPGVFTDLEPNLSRGFREYRAAALGFCLMSALLAQAAAGVRAQPAQGPAVPVTLAQAKRKDVAEFTSGIGTVQAFQSVLLRARVDGTLDRIAFQEGQSVKPGDLLAEIDPRPYQAALDQARANAPRTMPSSRMRGLT